MQYGQRYRIERRDLSIVEGEYIQTKGDDDNYPTFELADGSRLGVHKDNVLGPVDDSCPPQGIERPALDNFEHGRPELDTSGCTGWITCRRDPHSGEIIYCEKHYDLLGIGLDG